VSSLSAQGQLTLSETIREDDGFRAFRLAESSFAVWNGNGSVNEEEIVHQLELHIEHTLPGRSSEDILFEILLKSGFPLTTKFESLTLSGMTVYSVAEGAMLICLEKELTQEAIKAIADRKPERVVCLDEGFAGNDQLKTNAVQIMKTKGVTSFRTV
jgi:adenine-specific DNA-methyltransferase